METSSKFLASPIEKESAPFSVLIFRIGKQWMALPTAALKEITSYKKELFHRVPLCRNSSILGIANLKGRLILGVSLHRLLNSVESGPFHRLIAIQCEERMRVFPVEEVAGIYLCEKVSDATVLWNGAPIKLLDAELIAKESL